LSHKHVNNKLEDIKYDLEVANIEEKLKSAKLDPAVGIRIVSIVTGKDIGFFVTEIDERVQAHFHKQGDEFYHILRGEGTIYIGEVIIQSEENSSFIVKWKSPIRVQVDDVFNIPAGYAHSLVRTGEHPLVISFICPPTHLETDRFLVDNP
jgi:mannose-6-phosphate isomerase-like protein (cupin superfamily)